MFGSRGFMYLYYYYHKYIVIPNFKYTNIYILYIIGNIYYGVFR